MNIPCNKTDHDILAMQDRLMDRIVALDAELADEFKEFTRIYRRQFLPLRDKERAYDAAREAFSLCHSYKSDRNYNIKRVHTTIQGRKTMHQVCAVLTALALTAVCFGCRQTNHLFSKSNISEPASGSQ
jgi:hypothetical protein